MFGLDERSLEKLRKKYHEGARVELISMNDVQAPQKGTLGTVFYVDDIGTIHVRWDNDQSLGVVYGEDMCKVVSEK